MPEVTTGSRGYKQVRVKRYQADHIIVYSSFIMNYGFLYLLNLCIEFIIYYF